MLDFWKKAPSGGELTSALSMEKMLQIDLEETMELIRSSHTTFLGPNIADKTYKEGYDQLLGNMGYRLWISKARWPKKRSAFSIGSCSSSILGRTVLLAVCFSL